MPVVTAPVPAQTAPLAHDGVILPRGRSSPLPVLHQDVKRMRYLLVGAVFSSAYSIFLAVTLSTKFSLVYLPTAAVSLWTLSFLFPLEMAHHAFEGTSDASKANKAVVDPQVSTTPEVVATWVVPKTIIERSYATSVIWLLCAVRSVVSYTVELTPHQRDEFGSEVWLVAALEVASAALLYRLATKWTPESDEPLRKVPTSKKSSAAASSKKAATVSK